MSFNLILEKLLETIKIEIKKEENINVINNDIIKPIVIKVLDDIYPYFFGGILFFMIMFILIFAILLLNLKICYK
tara:strand:+ start:1018 stop:1242 length:225 start_codon:yes stop_codon:yes gene_type:complete